MRCFVVVLFGFALAQPAGAQGPIEVPNAMAAHTFFIILITAAFLAWAASFSIQIMKGRTHRQNREALLKCKETVLDQITELETAPESGTINKGVRKRRMKELRGELTRVLERLGRASKATKKHA